MSDTDLTFFAESKKLRDKHCKDKDAVTQPIIKSMKGGKDFKALLMPCLFGAELYTLDELKVQKNNIYVVERSKQVLKTMKSNKLPHLKGINFPLDAQSALKQLDTIIAIAEDENFKFDLIYLDFFGQPDSEHYYIFKKIFKNKLLKKKGKLIVTFIKHRCSKTAKIINDKLLDMDEKIKLIPTQKILKIALDKCSSKRYNKVRMKDYYYKSKAGNNKRLNCVVTELETY